MPDTRDMFAAAAMQAFLSSQDRSMFISHEMRKQLANDCYTIADYMIVRRNQALPDTDVALPAVPRFFRPL